MPPIQQSIADMLDALRVFLPEPIPSLPAPGISLVSIEEKPVGIGNMLGEEIRNGFSVAVLKGGRLSANVRIQLWANDLSAVDAAVDLLHGQLLAARPSLQTNGFLRVVALETSLAEFVEPLSAWRKATDYSVLYEFRYEDNGGAESLISRIPVAINSEYNEAIVVTDRLVRWDNVSAPNLKLRGRFTLEQLSALTFVAGAMPTGSVRFVRTFDGAVGVPTSYPTLDLFLDAVAGDIPGDRHAEFTFPSYSDFIAAFSVTGDPVELGDWDEDMAIDEYELRRLTFVPPLQLPTGADRLEVYYQSAPLDQVAVLYLRALSN